MRKKIRISVVLAGRLRSRVASWDGVWGAECETRRFAGTMARSTFSSEHGRRSSALQV